MQISNPLIAALKIWLAGLLLGPVFHAIGSTVYDLVNKGETDFSRVGNLFNWVYVVLLGGIFSLPSALVLWLTLSIMHQFEQSATVFWTTILSITFLLTIIPFGVLAGWDENGAIPGIALAYLGGIWTGVFWAIYRPNVLEVADAEEPLDAHL